MPNPYQEEVQPQRIIRRIKVGRAVESNEPRKSEHGLIYPTNGGAVRNNNPGVSHAIGVNIIQNLILGHTCEWQTMQHQTQPSRTMRRGCNKQETYDREEKRDESECASE